MSNSDPNFLVRWLDRNPMSPLTRARYFLTIGAFNIVSTWKGYSDIVGAYNYVSPNNFVMKHTELWKPANPNYTLCVAYANADGSVVRYRLWTATGETFYSNIPQYGGQIIKKLFRFEIWNSSNGAATQLTDLTPILTSVLQNQDYRYAVDALLCQPTVFVTDFNSLGGAIQPDQAGLEVWLDATYGITFGTGTNVASWTSRVGTLVMSQAVGGQQPTQNIVGYIQFQDNQSLVANARIPVGMSTYYLVLLNGVIGGPNNNLIFSQNGIANSVVMSQDSGSGKMDVVVGGNNIPTSFATGGKVIVEINTTTGEVWMHDPSLGTSTLQGTSATTFLDTLNLVLGGGGYGTQFMLDEQGNFILDENNNPVLLENQPSTPGAGFGIFHFLAYSAQTAAARIATLQFLMDLGIPLPFVFPTNAVLPLNS